MKTRIILLAILAAGVQAPAATVAVRQTNLDIPYLWQSYSFDPATGEYFDQIGSRNFDVDGDGLDDIGFAKGFTEEQLVLTSLEVEILVRKVGGPNDIGGVAARFDAGSILGPASVTTRYTYFSLSPHEPYYHPYSRDELGEYYDNFDEPLPRDVLVTGSINPGAEDLWKGRSGYLGYRMLKDDGWHYGWVYVEKDPLLTVIGGYVTAYAYETTPNTPILAQIPEPSINMMAAFSIMSWLCRRRR